MNALFEVLTIAIGTAVLAAVVVAADWDLGVIRAWQALTTPNVRPDRHSIWSPGFAEPPVTGSVSVGGRPGSAGFEAADAISTATSGKTDRARADPWPAAAATHRLGEFTGGERGWDDEQSASGPAISLRDALAARRGDRPVDAEAA